MAVVNINLVTTCMDYQYSGIVHCALPKLEVVKNL